MALRETFQVVIDVTTEGAQKSLKRLKSDVASADGAMGKARAAASGMGAMLGQFGAQAAITAGVAIAAFGVKAVKAFQDTALAAGRFADATGISVEAASRLAEVAGDLGIESDAVQAAIMRMNVAIEKNGPAIKRMGDEIVRAKDGSVDSAASFQNLVTRIGAIPNATERAKVAQQVFGRGYAQIAEMMEMSAGELATALGNVSEQKVIDEAELAKARKFRDSMDALRDRVDDLMLGFGEDLLPVVTDVTDAVTGMADTFRDVSDAIEGFAGGGIVDILSPIDNIASGLGKVFGENVSTADRFKGGLEAIAGIVPGLGEKVSEWADATDEAGRSIEYGTEEAEEMARVYRERVSPAIDKSTTYAEDLEAATEKAKLEAERLEQQWQDLFDEIDADRAVLNLEQQFDDLKKAQLEAFYAGVAGAEDAGEKQRYYQHMILDTKDLVGEYGQELGDLPLEVVTEINALVDAHDIEKAEQTLATLTRYREARIRPVILPDRIDRTEPPRLIPVDGQRANGGPMRAGGTYLVGERGPELVVPNRASTVIPNHRLGAAAAAPMVVNITTGADPEEVVRAIERYRRRNGSLPF
jgi:hypothetical protein